eukprot:TRINITY_DN9531_c0_g1_i1.p1 TRINITY_DN9531_c0_g1~~TRINITY_DN9531_c0_g1_i1.p1  ORF type:complete len:427 (+),score=99.12 TRINITY_DN9531_c0_g1_i1:127-1407(+)
MIRRPPRSTLSSSSAASDVYKRQVSTQSTGEVDCQMDGVEENSSPLHAIPLTTAAVAVSCAIFTAYANLLSSSDLNQYALCAGPVIHGEVWRLITSVLAHSGPMHLVMNLFSFVAIASHLESVAGSLWFGGILLLLTATSHGMYIVMCIALSLVKGDDWMSYCSVGISGVIFALLVIALDRVGDTPQRIFLFAVPPKLYPWVLLLILQALLPNISWMGHLCGILAGHLYLRHYLDFAMPSDATATSIDQSSTTRWIAAVAPNYRERASGLRGGENQYHPVQTHDSFPTAQVAAGQGHRLGGPDEGRDWEQQGAAALAVQQTALAQMVAEREKRLHQEAAEATRRREEDEELQKAVSASLEESALRQQHPQVEVLIGDDEIGEGWDCDRDALDGLDGLVEEMVDQEPAEMNEDQMMELALKRSQSDQ